MYQLKVLSVVIFLAPSIAIEQYIMSAAAQGMNPMTASLMSAPLAAEIVDEMGEQPGQKPPYQGYGGQFGASGRTNGGYENQNQMMPVYPQRDPQPVYAPNGGFPPVGLPYDMHQMSNSPSSNNLPPSNSLPNNFQPSNPMPNNVQPGNPMPNNVQPGNPMPNNFPPNNFPSNNPMPNNVQPGNPMPNNFPPNNFPSNDPMPNNFQPGNPNNFPPSNFMPSNQLPSNLLPSDFSIINILNALQSAATNKGMDFGRRDSLLNSPQAVPKDIPQAAAASGNPGSSFLQNVLTLGTFEMVDMV